MEQYIQRSLEVEDYSERSRSKPALVCSWVSPQSTSSPLPVHSREPPPPPPIPNSSLPRLPSPCRPSSPSSAATDQPQPPRYHPLPVPLPWQVLREAAQGQPPAVRWPDAEKRRCFGSAVSFALPAGSTPSSSRAHGRCFASYSRSARSMVHGLSRSLATLSRGKGFRLGIGFVTGAAPVDSGGSSPSPLSPPRAAPLPAGHEIVARLSVWSRGTRAGRWLVSNIRT
ncbi:formin-like protein 6 [Triticum aestivum]|uniref:formin-like protein 6 n=1 Tax=Triticum aestivum TaxID=4565 RepID=UPI001D00C695|nr:formin-like protein 6 [Triticum aestivum]